jgi:hypothetical protein
VSVLLLQIFVSLCLVAGSVVLYIFTVRESTFEHSDRLALAPLDDDEPSAATATTARAESADPNRPAHRIPDIDQPRERS